MFRSTKLVLFALLSGFLILASCGSDKPIDQSESSVNQDVVVLDSTFVKFYNTFHSDSIFQLDHVAFPLENSHEETIEGPWTRENWILHRPFQSHDGSFVRNYDIIGKVVVEEIEDVSGFFKLERRFGQLSSGWNLIYYKITTAEVNQPG